MGRLLRFGFLILFFLPKYSASNLIYHVKEEKAIGSYIGNIAADSHLSDRVVPEHVPFITFSQLQRRGSNSISQLFNVSSNGKLFTAQALDAETLCIYNKECFRIVKVAVRKANKFMKILKIKVIIQDINDHVPQFPVKQVNIQFSERDGKGSKISVPNAIDKDVGILNSQITYQLRNNNNRLFSLSVFKRIDGRANLAIILEGKLNREEKDTYMLQIVAKDGGSLPMQSVLNVQIAVNDVNDNPPVFSHQMYNVSIKNTHQMSLPVVVLAAKDLDAGENSKILYHFSPKTSDEAKSHFELNKTTGEILLKKIFPVGQKVVYKLFVDATDGGEPPLSSTAIVLVNVMNQQNNAPNIEVDFVFTLTENVASISEDIEAGSFLAYVMVTDNDMGLNGEVNCELQHDKFQLLNFGFKEYKVIVKNSVDREKEDHYDIVIKCSDRGSPPLRAENRFSIRVTDVNDVKPQFTKDTFKFLTYENEKSNFPVGFINATDPDLELGGQLTYFLLGTDTNDIPFQITNYGFISTKSSLDREQQEVYKFKVFVKDNGTPPLNSTANIIVKVVDENDNAPYFTFPSVDPFSLDFYYHPQSKNDLTVLKASDRDNQENAFLKYEIIGGNDKHLFTVNPYTGVLSFSRTVYQNDAGTYDLKFMVKDSGMPSLSAATTLTLSLSVSNTTSPMLAAVHQQSDSLIDVTWVVIIVPVAVVLSVVIVISVTLCVIRTRNQNRALQHTAISASKHPRNEMRQLISQSNNTVPVSCNPDDIMGGSSLSMHGQLYPVDESRNEWKSSSLSRWSQRTPQMYHQPIAVTSGEVSQHNTAATLTNYLHDTLRTQQRPNEPEWSEAWQSAGGGAVASKDFVHS
ncbi:protocadherin gamma-A11 isoform X1 [Octopus sinensis]|uniref:Protocadherin gamma-A11 isoform X1 n=1 Tax=Octopus sinensis TaxID=2607531 RepID=A0A7E6FCA3_9MOLL|nr:protocadherin gamma-A11 isoform X1 [Octopus sinensis]